MSEFNTHLNEGSKTVQHFCTTVLQQASMSMEWSITNFNLLRCDSGFSLESSTFESENSHTGTWKLRLFPKYGTEDNIGLFFVKNSMRLRDVLVECKACLIDAEGKETNKKRISSVLTANEIGFPDFIKKINLGESLLPNGKLTIRCSVTVTLLNTTYTSAGQLDCGTTLEQDLYNLLKEELLSDVILVCGDRKCPVHKCVLSARSPVFSAMFTHDLKEKQDNVVEIKDMGSDVLENLLSYIYTDKILDYTTTDMAIKLLKVADKYNLLELKINCEKHLKKNLSIPNLCMVAEIADFYYLDSLKEYCIEFMLKQGKEVMFSENSISCAPHYLFEGVFKKIFENSQNYCQKF